MTELTSSRSSTLSEYGYGFLSKTIELLVAHPDFYFISKGALKREYFNDSEPHKCLIDLIDKYFEKYNIIPTVSELRTINNVNPNPILKDKCDYILNVISINIDSGFDFTHYEFYVEELKKFIKRKVYETTFKECLPLLQTGKFDDIDVKFHSAVENVDFDINIKEVSEMFYEVSKPESRRAVPTGFDELDGALRGGLSPGEIGFIFGEIGSGKSWVLTQLGINALKNKYNVLHISLENRTRDAVLRYVSLINGVYVDNIPQQRDEMDKQLKTFFEKHNSHLWFEEFSTGGLTVSEIYGLVKRYQNKTKKKIHLLILDYIDILDLSMYKGEDWQKLRTASEEIRKLEFDLDLACWTATHFNAEGVNAEFKRLHQVAGGMNRFKVVDVILSFNRRPESIDADRPTLQLVKNRNGVVGKIFNMIFDIERCNISITGVTTVEEMKKKIEDSKPKKLIDLINRHKEKNDDLKVAEGLNALFKELT